MNENIEDSKVDKVEIYEKEASNQHLNRPRIYGSLHIASYVDQKLTQELDIIVKEFLEKLYHFQRRTYKMAPAKHKAKKRYDIGMKQAKKAIELEKCVILIVAPDVAADFVESIEDLMRLCCEHNVQYVFALSRATLKQIFHFPGSAPGVVTIRDADGAFDLLKKIRAEGQRLKVAKF